MQNRKSLKELLQNRDRIEDIPAAPQHLFDRAYNIATSAESPANALMPTARIVAVSVLVIGTAIFGFHTTGSKHAWSGWNLISAGEIVSADGANRKINVYQGLSKVREIQLAPGGVVQHGDSHWDLKSGEATFHVKPVRTGRPFHVRAGGLDFLVEERAHYTVSGQHTEDATHAPVTVEVAQGTVHCCTSNQPFPILEGEKITLVKRDGRSVILAYESE